MAESPIERLKRLAKEKKEAAAKVVAAPVTQPALAVAEVEPEAERVGLAETKVAILGMMLSAEELANERRALVQESTGAEDSGTPVNGASQESVGGDSGGSQPETKDVQTTSGDIASAVQSTDVKPANSTHPLAMDFAEMEQALLTKDPEFKMILRNIHRHLALDPDLVTQMSEAEIQAVVSGLVVIANAEVVEPAKAKTAKAAVAKAKKQVINVDDL